METKLTLKTLLPYIGIGIIIVILSFVNKSCNNKQDLVIVPNDGLNAIIKDKEVTVNYYLKKAKIDSLKIDSLKHLKPKYIKGRDRVRDSLIYVSDSICVKNLTMLYNECQKVDSVNNAIITNQENHIINDSHVIGNLTDIVAMQKYKLTNDSLEKVALLEQIKSEFKRGLKKGRKQGTLVGAVGTQAVNTGVKLLIK